MSIYLGAHRRWHPFEKVWILNSTNRLQRKWQGKKNLTKSLSPKYDSSCPFCPGNIRDDGHCNPKKSNVYPFAFNNSNPTISPLTKKNYSDEQTNKKKLFRAKSIYGIGRIVNFHPQHNLTFSLMSKKECEKVIKLWQKEYRELGKIPYITTINIFENNGFGSGLPHPHNQIIGTSEIPSYLERILGALRDHKEQSGECLLCQTQEEEIRLDQRVIYENSDFVAFVPFWAIWPFEVWIVAKDHKKSFLDLEDKELKNLSLVYQMVCIKLDNLFNEPCPYSSAIYQAPTDDQVHSEMHFHLVFRPPVLRSVEVWKWMVGYEFMAQPQRDISPEQAAKLLKATSNQHYSKINKK